VSNPIIKQNTYTVLWLFIQFPFNDGCLPLSCSWVVPIFIDKIQIRANESVTGRTLLNEA
jgi:hypothetical protein